MRGAATGARHRRAGPAARRPRVQRQGLRHGGHRHLVVGRGRCRPGTARLAGRGAGPRAWPAGARRCRDARRGWSAGGGQPGRRHPRRGGSAAMSCSATAPRRRRAVSQWRSRSCPAHRRSGTARACTSISGRPWHWVGCCCPAEMHAAAEALLPPMGGCPRSFASSRPWPARRGDRLVLRSYSPLATVAGARVLDPAPIIRQWSAGGSAFTDAGGDLGAGIGAGAGSGCAGLRGGAAAAAARGVTGRS